MLGWNLSVVEIVADVERAFANCLSNNSSEERVREFRALWWEMACWTFGVETEVSAG